MTPEFIAILAEIRAQLTRAADPAVAEGSRRFFKEAVKPYGVKSAEVGKIAKRAQTALKKHPKSEVFNLCGELWSSGYLEEGGAACLLAHSRVGEYQPEDLDVFEDWLDRYVGNWAACDTLCNHSVGDLVIMYPQALDRLKQWTGSENRWKRRAAAVSLIIPGRRGMFLPDILEISERLLGDGDDLVQKGYGWMLKAAGEAHPEEVFDYLLPRREVMPRTAYRYALEKLPKEWRARAMEK